MKTKQYLCVTTLKIWGGFYTVYIYILL